MEEDRKLTPDMTTLIEAFVMASTFESHGGIITDLDGTAIHEDRGRIFIPPPVEFGLRALYERGRPVVLNSLRFPLSVMRTFGKEWLAISGAPIPIVSMNGSQIGFVYRDEKGELAFDEIAAFPLSASEIDSVLAGVDALLDDNIRDVLLFYYPRDWRLGEMIWTPVAEKILHVKEKYTSASSVSAVDTVKLAEMLHAEEICMIFLLIERPADDLMAYQHSKPSNFFTAKGVDKRSGAYAIAEHLDFDLKSSVGAGDTGMDIFLDAVGLSIHVGNHELPFSGYHNTIKLRDSFQLGDLFFYMAGLILELANEDEQTGKTGHRKVSGEGSNRT